jgi:hypothetical protein
MTLDTCAWCGERECVDELIIYCEACCKELWELYGDSYMTEVTE